MQILMLWMILIKNIFFCKKLRSLKLNKIHVGEHFIEFRVILLDCKVINVGDNDVQSIFTENFKSSEFFVNGMCI